MSIPAKNKTLDKGFIKKFDKLKPGVYYFNAFPDGDHIAKGDSP
jgi:hypothetical protein